MSTDSPGSSRRRERASSTLNSLVRAARDRNPTDQTVHRISEGLVTSGVFASAPPSFDATTSAPKFLHLKIGAGLLALAAGWITVHSMQQGPDPAVTNGTPPSVASPAAEIAAPPAVVADTAPSSATAISVDALPSAVSPPVVARGGGPASRSASATGAVAVPPGASILPSEPARDTAKPAATELELVQQAQAALASDPQRALAITREQGRLYPDGEYVQEREVFAVEALSRLGQKDEAWQRAAALVRRFPRTPHAARLELATGRRLVPPASPSTASSDITSR